MSDDGGMKALDYPTGTGTDHRPQDRRRELEPTEAAADEEPLADHHAVEVLAALRRVARVRMSGGDSDVPNFAIERQGDRAHSARAR
jgi:hypothetical protein